MLVGLNPQIPPSFTWVLSGQRIRRCGVSQFNPYSPMLLKMIKHPLTCVCHLTLYKFVSNIKSYSCKPSTWVGSLSCKFVLLLFPDFRCAWWIQVCKKNALSPAVLANVSLYSCLMQSGSRAMVPGAGSCSLILSSMLGSVMRTQVEHFSSGFIRLLTNVARSPCRNLPLEGTGKPPASSRLKGEGHLQW